MKITNKGVLCLLCCIVYVVLISFVAIQQGQINNIKAERDKYNNNAKSLLEQVDTLRNDSTMKAIQIRTLKLSLDEYKQYRSADAAVIKSLKIKLKNVQSVSNTEITVEVPIESPVQHDTVYLKNSTTVPIETIRYENEHIHFNGIIKNDSLKANFSVPITLTQIVHKVPKHKFLWWSWGCKAIKQIITCDNPYVNINYAEYIEIQK